MSATADEQLGKDLEPGAHHYRAFIGPPQRYDLMSAAQFNLLTALGLREDHTLLDVGCGSLRGGKLFIPYLLPEHYCGIEPEQWLLDEGISNEIGQDQLRLKRPTFINDRSFTLSAFNRQFDFILAQSIFSHTSKSQLRRCVAQAATVLKPQGIFVASYLPGEQDYEGTEWFYPGAIPFTFQHLASVAQAENMVCLPLAWQHPNDQAWVAFVHPGQETRVAGFGEQAPALRSELELCRKRLNDLESHPYVRVGMGLKKVFRRLRT